MILRRVAGALALLAAAAGAGPAAAAAPEAQRAELDSGTAILQYSEAGDAGREAARRAGLRTSLGVLDLSPDFFEALPMVAVAGLGVRAARRRALARGGGRAPRPAARLRALPVDPAGVRRQAASRWRPRASTAAGSTWPSSTRGSMRLHADLARSRGRELRGRGRTGRRGRPGRGRGPGVPRCPATPATPTRTGTAPTWPASRPATARASSGFHRGVAPGAGVVGYSVGVGPTILSAVAAYDHILAHPELGVVVVNSSFGVSGGGTLRLHRPGQPGHQAPERRGHRHGLLERQLGHQRGRHAAGVVRLREGRPGRPLQDQPLFGRALGDERGGRPQGSGRSALRSSTSRSTRPAATTPRRRH